MAQDLDPLNVEERPGRGYGPGKIDAIDIDIDSRFGGLVTKFCE